MVATTLLDWHRSWEIRERIVYCRICSAKQPENKSERKFVHLYNCRAIADPFPWKALNQLIFDFF